MPDEFPNILFIISLETPAAFWDALKAAGLLAEDHAYIQ